MRKWYADRRRRTLSLSYCKMRNVYIVRIKAVFRSLDAGCNIPYRMAFKYDKAILRGAGNEECPFKRLVPII